MVETLEPIRRESEETQIQFLRRARGLSPDQETTTTTRDLTEAEVQQEIARLKQLRATESTQAIEDRISQARRSTAAAEESLRLAKETGQGDVSRLTSELESARFRNDNIISELEKLKDEAATGDFTPNSIVSFALERVSGRESRAELRKAEPISPQDFSKTTATERTLRMSLPRNLRDLPVEEVRRIQEERRSRATGGELVPRDIEVKEMEVKELNVEKALTVPSMVTEKETSFIDKLGGFVQAPVGRTEEGKPKSLFKELGLVFVDVADIAGKKTGFEGLLKDTPLDIRVSRERSAAFLGGLGQSAFLLGLTSATRGQIGRQIGTPTKVKFGALDTQVKGGGVLSKISFKATRGTGIGKTTLTGKATGFAKSTIEKQVGTVSKLKIESLAAGQIGRKALTPRGVRIVKVKGFGSVARGTGLAGRKVLVTDIKGISGLAGKRVGFRSVGIQEEVRSLAKSASGTISEGGVAFSEGLRLKVPLKSLVTAKRGQLLVSTLKIPTPTTLIPQTKIGEFALKGSVEAAITRFSPLVTSSKAGLALSGLGRTPSEIRVTELTSGFQRIPPPSVIPLQKTPTIQIPKGISLTRARLGTRFRQPQAVIPKTAFDQPTAFKEITKQRTGLRQVTRARVITRTRPTPIIIPKPAPLIPKTRFPPPPVAPLPFKLSQPKPIKKKKLRRLRGEGIPFIAGFTSKALGLTQAVTRKQLRKQALSGLTVGLRKIPILK